MNGVTLQASRNGIRVGDLVGDFDVFTELWVHLESSLYLTCLCTDCVSELWRHVSTSKCLIFVYCQVPELGRRLREALPWLASRHRCRVGLVQGTFVWCQVVSVVIRTVTAAASAWRSESALTWLMLSGHSLNSVDTWSRDFMSIDLCHETAVLCMSVCRNIASSYVLWSTTLCHICTKCWVVHRASWWSLKAPRPQCWTSTSVSVSELLLYLQKSFFLHYVFSFRLTMCIGQSRWRHNCCKKNDFFLHFYMFTNSATITQCI